MCCGFVTELLRDVTELLRDVTELLRDVTPMTQTYNVQKFFKNNT